MRSLATFSAKGSRGQRPFATSWEWTWLEIERSGVPLVDRRRMTARAICGCPKSARCDSRRARGASLLKHLYIAPPRFGGRSRLIQDLDDGGRLARRNFRRLVTASPGYL